MHAAALPHAARTCKYTSRGGRSPPPLLSRDLRIRFRVPVWARAPVEEIYTLFYVCTHTIHECVGG